MRSKTLRTRHKYIETHAHRCNHTIHIMRNVQYSAHVGSGPCAWTTAKKPDSWYRSPKSATRSLACNSKNSKKEDRPSIEVHLRSNNGGGPGTKQASKQASKEAEETRQGRERGEVCLSTASAIVESRRLAGGRPDGHVRFDLHGKRCDCRTASQAWM